MFSLEVKSVSAMCPKRPRHQASWSEQGYVWGPDHPPAGRGRVEADHFERVEATNAVDQDVMWFALLMKQGDRHPHAVRLYVFTQRPRLVGREWREQLAA
jgi:hypothetical protein